MELRVARHSNDLKPLVDFYTQIIGLKVLFSFEDHNGYNGVFIGKPGQNWHIEFTSSNDKVDHHFDEEDLLVFYPQEESEYKEMAQRIEDNGIRTYKARNPYWDTNGILIKDPDGFGVIVSNVKVK